VSANDNAKNKSNKKYAIFDESRSHSKQQNASKADSESNEVKTIRTQDGEITTDREGSKEFKISF
jgi:hypothetical protein